VDGGVIGMDKKDLEVQEDIQKILSEIGRAISERFCVVTISDSQTCAMHGVDQ
jgi:hypothetical protein